METVATTGLTPAHQRPPKLEASDHNLIPGLPDEITLDNIAPKLSWRDFYTLSLVSPAWLEANRSRQVYDARVRSHSTETLAVLNYCAYDDTSALAVFSIKGSGGRFCWELPPIPGFERGIPQWCNCVTLDGKVYILGGGLDSICRNGEGKVFVMDLAGQRGWQECKSMKYARQAFGCGVKDGKIYVFGGMMGSIPIGASEVYDPNEDTWSPITPMPSLRYLHNVEIMGEELVVHSGKVWEHVQISSARQLKFNPHEQLTNNADFLELYNPVKDEWRVKPFRQEYSNEKMFVSEGKFHLLNGSTMTVYHGEGHEWLSSNNPLPFILGEAKERIGKRFCSCAAMGEDAPDYFFPFAVLSLNDELLAAVDVPIFQWEERPLPFTFLMFGKGFRTGNEEISMELAPFFGFNGYCETKQFIVPIEL